jgi:hypothetical protein
MPTLEKEQKKKDKKKRKVMEVTDEPVQKFGTGTERVMSPKQIRARARRAGKIHKEEMEKLYKPIEEWDEEELARGRPRAKDGTFKGASPAWITREVHEAAMARFKGIIESKMRGETVTAMSMLHTILADDEVDEKGRPLVAASTKLDAIKFLIEHAVGKPTQRVEQDISVRLQGLLAVATVGPGSMPAELPAPPEWEEDDDVMDLDSEES